jgi:hypothetical protein
VSQVEGDARIKKENKKQEKEVVSASSNPSQEKNQPDTPS